MKKLFTLGSILLAAALTLCCAGCGEEASSKEEATSSASSKATADELTDFDGTVKTDLSKLHEVDYENGNAFAGAWKITEGQGDQFQSFTFVFDGKDNAYMMIGSMGYCGKYELNEDTKIFGTQQAVGLNGTYTYTFSDDNNTVELYDTETKLTTKMQKLVSFTFIPRAEPDSEIDPALLGAWKDESGGYIYFEDNGIMYETQKAISFTFYTYSAKNGVVDNTYYMLEAEKGSYKYKVDGDKLTYNGYTYTRISADELV